MNDKIYDTAIIGGGPAGYTAALYCVRAGFSTVVLEKLSAGGQMCRTDKIDNYPGFEDGVDGFTLGYKMQQTAERFGAETIRTEVISVSLTDEIKRLNTPKGEFKAKTVIIATGAEHKRLGVKGEEEFTGKGVGYCATCDGMFYKGKTVCVVGGGNSAVQGALFLSRICEKVILIHRGDKLKASKIFHKPLKMASNVEFKWNCTTEEIMGEGKVNAVSIKHADGSRENIKCDGIFINIGNAPETEIFKGQLELDKYGYIIADESTKTNIAGVFAAGDVRTKELRQVVTAAGDGATASHFVEMYLA